jgi:hypothetical protein
MKSQNSSAEIPSAQLNPKNKYRRNSDEEEVVYEEVITPGFCWVA